MSNPFSGVQNFCKTPGTDFEKSHILMNITVRPYSHCHEVKPSPPTIRQNDCLAFVEYSHRLKQVSIGLARHVLLRSFLDKHSGIEHTFRMA